ncbi:CAP domain-containing protein [Thermoanaerobacterium sp. DL9XJH110]|uniref:CAP domain-containing protein n=1 Tax=Thermoanaerobacterium sp. DL9XJH110 TaxID=3386643 RepID=UPI003BB6A668
MNYRRRYLFVALVLAFAVLLPGVAGAAWNIKITVNGLTQTLDIPDIAGSPGTYRFVYTYKDGRWVLTPGGQETIKPNREPSNTTPADTGKSVGRNDSVSRGVEESNVKGLTADEQKMFDLVNAERKKAGLDPLKIDMRLVDISRKKSRDMIEKNYFGHTSPTYGTPFNALKANGIAYTYAGENLAGAPTVEQAHKSLMASPGHRANILNPNYDYVGIGIVDGGPYGKMFTQTFIGIK